MLGANVNEVDVDAVDLGHELRLRIQLRFRLSPVVAGAPILDERLDLGELYPLRLIVDRLAVGPARRRDAPAQLIKFLLWDIGGERTDRGVSNCRCTQRCRKQTDGPGCSCGGKHFAA